MTKATIENISRVLWSIHAPPNRRERPLDGDLPGDFDFWFDGGACRMVTGSTQYSFGDGTTVSVGVLPYVHVHIRFSSGEVVQVRATDRSGLG